VVRNPRTDPKPGDILCGKNRKGEEQYRRVVKVLGLEGQRSRSRIVVYIVDDYYGKCTCLMKRWLEWAEFATIVKQAK
jgi:hypothetical protein